MKAGPLAIAQITAALLNRSRPRFALLLLVLAAVVSGSRPAATQGGPLMTLPGAFEVSEAGAATYTVPLAVPPGTAGVEPKLSLVYRSQGVNGLLGVGWSLSGLSEIARCPRTIAQDSVRGSVNYDTNDRFCLDGQRLIVVNGTYGAANSEYRTELETFAEVKASATLAGTGPASFTVRTKSGLVMEYGTTTDSRVEASGRSEAQLWALARVLDRHGNAMTITYVEEAGQARPVRIDYTTNTAAGLTAAPLSVRMTYETRTDAAPAGDRRLARITTYLNGPPEVVVSEYRLIYESGPVTARSRITQLQRCDGIGGTARCIPATTFAYSDTVGWPTMTDYGRRLAASDFNGASNAAWQNDTAFPRLLGDVNGDGRADVVRFAADGVWVALSTGDGFSTPTRWNTGFGTNDGYAGRDSHPRLLADVNADGLPDIVGFKGGNVHVSLGTGTSFAPATIWLTGHPAWTPDPGSPPRNLPRLLDLNGDGFADILTLGTSTFVNLSTGSGFSPTQTWYGTGASYSYTFSGTSGSGENEQPCSTTYTWTEMGMPHRTADANGDGLPDLYWFSRYLSGVQTPQVLRSTTTSFLLMNPAGISVTCGYAYGSLFAGTDTPSLADVDGDGVTDFTHFDGYWWNIGGDNDYWVWEWTGNFRLYRGLASGGYVDVGTFPSGGSGGVSLNISTSTLTDIDGDGLADFVVAYHDGVRYNRSRGVTFGGVRTWISQYGTAQGWGGHPLRFVDVDGDGRPDIVGFGSDGVYTTRSGSLPFPDLIVSIGNGLGVARTIEYRTLSQATPVGQAPLYTKGSGSLYPHVDLQVPLPVVRETRVPSRFATNGTPDAWMTTRYRYGELRGETTGRGMKGFRWLEALQVETNLRVRTEYSQDYPFTGSPTLVERALVNAQGQVVQVISRVTNTYGCFDFAGSVTTSCQTLAGRRYFPYRTTSVDEGWDLNGAVMPKATTTTEFAEPTTAFFGNATKVTVRTETNAGAQAWIRETTNTYSNDVTNWLLGRLTQSVVQSTTPN